MRLVCLNAWGGTRFEELLKFIKQEAPATDIFCFQEVFSADESYPISHNCRANLLEEITSALPDFKGFFASQLSGYDFEKKVDFPVSIGLAIFTKNQIITASESGEDVIFGEKNKILPHHRFPSLLQHLRFANAGQTYTLFNFHGIADWPKTDTPERLAQSQKILDIMERTPGSKILGGDFNLSHRTRSVAILEERLQDLIKKYGIAKTRSSLHPFDDEDGKISDYLFLSPDLEEKSFSVPGAGDFIASDHLPLVLEL